MNNGLTEVNKMHDWLNPFLSRGDGVRNLWPDLQENERNNATIYRDLYMHSDSPNMVNTKLQIQHEHLQETC
jgi:hypothetical protein